MVAKSAALLGFLSLAAPAIASPVPKAARSDCDKSVTINSGDSCIAIASANGISLEQLLSYNSGINQGCTNLIAGNSICVAVSGDKPTATTTTAAKGESTSKATPAPGKCDKTVTVSSGDSCWALASANGLSLEQLISLNPSVNSGCTNLVIGQKLCIGGGGSAPAKPTTTTAKGESKATPAPGKCDKTVTVSSGDSCWALANANGLSLEQLISLNPSVNSGCTNLVIGQKLCIGGGGSAPAKPTTTTTAAATATDKPESKCKKTYKVQGGDSCWAIANANGITVDQLNAWNAGFSDDCSSLYAGDTICISK